MTEHIIVLSGLTARRAELAGEADAIRVRLLKIATDLAQLDAVIRQFDPNYTVGSIRPRKPRPVGAAHPGERSRIVLDVLRRVGEPIAARDIVERVLELTGLTDADHTTRMRVTRRTEVVLSRQEKRGVVRATREKGQLVMWEVAR